MKTTLRPPESEKMVFTCLSAVIGQMSIVIVRILDNSWIIELNWILACFIYPNNIFQLNQNYKSYNRLKLVESQY